MNGIQLCLAVAVMMGGVSVFGATGVSAPVSVDISSSAVRTAPMAVGYSPVWNGAVEGDGAHVDILAVFRAGQESVSTQTLLMAGADESGICSLSLPEDGTRALRLVHRTIRDGVIVDELMADVALGASAESSSATFADTTEKKLDRVAETPGAKVNLAASASWVDGAATISLEHEETARNGQKTVLELYQGVVPPSETLPFIPIGLRHTSCRCILRFFDSAGNEIGEPLTAAYAGHRVGGLRLIVR